MSNYYPGYQPIYPAAYQGYPGQGYYGYQMPPVQQVQQVQQQPQQQTYQQDNSQQNYQPPIQNGGFVPVQSEEEARRFPVQPGRCVTFRNISAPYCYTKTQGYNTFEPFEFKKYRVEEEKEIEAPVPQMPSEEAEPAPAPVQIPYATKEEMDVKVADLRKAINGFEDELEEIRGLMGTIVANKKPAAKNRKDEDDA